MLNFKTIVRWKLSRWRAIAGLDFHVLVTLLFRGWAIVAGAATVFLLPLWLSPTEQGYYFTFASVLALQIFFELGLNQIVMQLVSHEVAHLTETADGRLTGKEAHLGRLSSLARLIRRWYGVAGMLFALIGGIAGALFFSQKGTEPMSVWLGVWVVLVGATAVNLWLSPGLAVMEGCAKVGQVARLRLAQSVLGYAILWAVLLSGAGLWAATAVPVVSAVCTAYWLKSHGDMLQWLSSRAVDLNNQLSWRADVLPLQWRISVSWISGYFIFNLFTPLVFANRGAVEAGQFGMALSVFSAVTTVGMSWVNAKAPNFTMHISRGERSVLNVLFKAVAIRSIVVTTLMSLGAVSMVWFLTSRGMTVMSRISAPEVLAGLAIVAIANSMITAAAVYMRAHREEPMLLVSVVTGLLTAVAAYFGSRIGVLYMVIVYAFITMCVSLPWTTWIFVGYFNRK
ncbi:hypothetical protein [Rhodoferax sp.]|uniref:hypothetical protein n=1 Tax=Rhodoferax sp. TaxID=50421 RepID=UPI003BB0B477